MESRGEVRVESRQAGGVSVSRGGGRGPAAIEKKKAPAALSHVDARGRVKMVDVGEKPVTDREAIARGSITMSSEARRLIRTRRREEGRSAADRAAGRHHGRQADVGAHPAVPSARR